MKQVSNYSCTSVTLKFDTHVPAERIAEIAGRNPREIGRFFEQGGIKEMTLTERRVIRLAPDAAPDSELTESISRAKRVNRAVNALTQIGIPYDSAQSIVVAHMTTNVDGQ
jgi:hypothetical protein